MRIYAKVCLLAGLLISTVVGAEADEAVRFFKQGLQVGLENQFVRLTCDLDSGTYAAVDRRNGVVGFTNASFALDIHSSRRCHATNFCKYERVTDALGQGGRLIISNLCPNSPTLLFEVVLYDGQPFVALGAGLRNDTERMIQLKRLSPLADATGFPNSELANTHYLLDGNGGGDPTQVTRAGSLVSYNNLCLTFNEAGQRRTLVMGGLTYADFVKYAQVRMKHTWELFAEDPVGKRVDPGQTYFPSGDRFYVDFVTRNAFESLERYGRALRDAQAVKLNRYTFPTVCLWYVNYELYGGQTGVNDSPGAVAEMDRIAASGFLDFSKAAVRLVPDCYGYDNQQMWYDDEHWSRYGSDYHTPVKGGHLKPPYETMAKFGQAIRQRGGIPIIYVQANWRSEDYCAAYPERMLFNQSHALRSDPLTNAPAPKRHPQHFTPCQQRNRLYYGADYTDAGTLAHMRQVYARLKAAGIGGLMFDYPWSAWSDRGGMDDAYSTTAAAYRTVFRLAAEGLGPEHWIQERCLEMGTDVALGCVDSQRTMWDNDELNARMVSTGGLRWYKNRVVINYDNDAKNLLGDDRDDIRRILTMSYVTSGRLLLGNSLASLPAPTIHDLTRIFPFPDQPQSARPVDAFVSETPRIYDYAVTPQWHQVTLYNDNNDQPRDFTVSLADDNMDGGLAMDRRAHYYAYDFWNDRLVGCFAGTEDLKQTLRPREARMLALHRKLDRPQFLATTRHVMQGVVDMPQGARWDEATRTLSGVSAVVRRDPYVVIIARNGYQPNTCKTEALSVTADLTVKNEEQGLVALTLKSDRNETVTWSVSFAAPDK